ncbi:MAG: protein kinase [Myxococcus sp.]|nr:protein kinase [Myxococcus sp.]
MSDDRSGTTLEERLKNGPLPTDEAVRIVWALCDRFEKSGKAETLGDVTPKRVTLYGRVAEVSVPDSTFMLGYSAPERASSGPTPRSDVYAMGALLVHALTGKPFDGTPLPPSANHLVAVVERCLQPDPAARFANLSELKRALVRMDRTLMSGPKLVAEAAMTRTSLGPWNLEGLLGEGSMGTVYKARHQALGRLAAIKVLRPEQYQDPELIHRFFQEARTVNQINHEHIVEISDFVQEPGPKGPSVVYCVMELLKGRTLADELESGPLRLDRGLAIIEQLCDALAAAHRVGVVHRDVKPDNIMLIERGGSKDYVKVLDFGVAKLTNTDGKAMVSTTEGAIIGTPICMSPEQAQGDDVDARSDVWAVGVILYRVLTGRFPFDAPTFVNIAVQIITRPYVPLPPKTAGGEPISDRLSRLVEKCLQKRRDLRPASMDEVRDELRAILRGDAELASAAAPRRRVVVAGAIAAALLVALAVGVVFRPAGEGPKVDPRVTGPVVAPVVPPVVEADAGAAEDAGLAVEALDAGAAAEVVDAGAPARVNVPPRPVKLSAALIIKALGELGPRLSGCGAKFPDQRKLLNGATAKLSFEIQRSGKLTAVKLDPPVQGTKLEKCVAAVLAANPLPPNDGNPKFSKPRVPLRFGE